MQRSTTQQPGSGYATAPSSGYYGRPGFFGGGGFFSSLAGGFIGAGLFGLLFGHGFMGGFGGFGSVIGLLFQLALIYFIATWIWRWVQRQPAVATGTSYGTASTSLGGMFGGGGASQPGRRDDVGIGNADYDAFERVLGEIQTAYSNEDLTALRSLATPEVVSYFSEDLAQNASRGVVNRVTDVKLLKGDLAEAWQEGGTEYATVAMRYALNDIMVERASGRVVEGGPQEVVESWTFRRVAGGPWILSAIQQPD
jgi:predicted lipid-binding transport protein (Tim44 family)